MFQPLQDLPPIPENRGGKSPRTALVILAIWQKGSYTMTSLFIWERSSCGKIKTYLSCELKPLPDWWEGQTVTGSDNTTRSLRQSGVMCTIVCWISCAKVHDSCHSGLYRCHLHFRMRIYILHIKQTKNCNFNMFFIQVETKHNLLFW